jgi:hypothetical protein
MAMNPLRPLRNRLMSVLRTRLGGGGGGGGLRKPGGGGFRGLRMRRGMGRPRAFGGGRRGL